MSKMAVKTWNLSMKVIQEISGILEEMVNTPGLKQKRRLRINILNIIMNTDPLRMDDQLG